MDKIYYTVDELIGDLLDYKCVINVKTKQESEEFIKVMRDKYNMGWCDGGYDTYYEICVKQTCYDFGDGANRMQYDDTYYYLSEKIKVVEYSKMRDLLVNGSL